MITYFQNLKIKGKLSTLVLIFLFSFVLFGIYNYIIIEKVRINSDIYNEISIGKDIMVRMLKGE